MMHSVGETPRLGSSPQEPLITHGMVCGYSLALCIREDAVHPDSKGCAALVFQYSP
jgi:hypothetical protein